MTVNDYVTCLLRQLEKSWYCGKLFNFKILLCSLSLNLSSTGIRGAVLALTVVHSNNVNYLGDDASVISSFTLSKSKLERRNCQYT